jgi:hypothetical protein
MPIMGFINVMKAINTAIRNGNGCGKNGTRVKISIMLTKVKMNAKYRIDLDSVGLPSLDLCIRFLNQPVKRPVREFDNPFMFNRDFIRDFSFGFDGSKHIV